MTRVRFASSGGLCWDLFLRWFFLRVYWFVLGLVFKVFVYWFVLGFVLSVRRLLVCVGICF